MYEHSQIKCVYYLEGMLIENVQLCSNISAQEPSQCAEKKERCYHSSIRVLTLRLILLPPFVWTSYFTVALYIPRTLRHGVSSSDVPWECGFAYDNTLTPYSSLTQSLIFRLLVTVAASAEWVLYMGEAGLVSYLGQSVGNSEEYPCHFRILPT